MYDYVTSELPEVLKNNFDKLDVTKASIMGHSMGGHGALTIFLKNPHKFKSVSAFSPVVHPTQVPWGTKGEQTRMHSQLRSLQRLLVTWEPIRSNGRHMMPVNS